MRPIAKEQIDAACLYVDLELAGIQKSQLIGSCSFLPPHECEDIDIAVLTDVNAMEFAEDLCHNREFTPCGDYDSKDGLWCAVRRGNMNLMLTSDAGFYDRYLTAMEVCKALWLVEKVDRIAVCQIVRDGHTALNVVTSRTNTYGGKLTPKLRRTVPPVSRDLPWYGDGE